MSYLCKALTLLAALGIGCTAVGARGARVVEAKPPAALEQARAAFAAAVASRDRTAVAKLSRFPLAVEGYGMHPTLSEAAFLHDKALFHGLFFDGDAELVKCLKTQPFAWQEDAKQFGARLWLLDCNGNEYFFGERGGAYLDLARRRIADLRKGALKMRPPGKPIPRPNQRDKVAQLPPEWTLLRAEPEEIGRA